MPDLNRIDAAQTIELTDGISLTAALATAAPAGTEAALIVRNIPSGTQGVSGTVTANQGTAAAGSGAWPVTITTTTDTVVKPGDSTNNAIRVNIVAGTAAVQGDVAHDAVDSGKPLKVGGQARTTNPTAVANADRVQAMFDDVGRQIVVQGQVRDLVTSNNITLTNTTETTLLAAGGAGVFHDVTLLVFSNTSATAVRVDIRDTTAGTVLFSMFLAANGGGAVVPFNPSLPQTSANTNWTAQLSAAVTDVRIKIVAVKNV